MIRAPDAVAAIALRGRYSLVTLLRVLQKRCVHHRNASFSRKLLSQPSLARRQERAQILERPCVSHHGHVIVINTSGAPQGCTTGITAIDGYTCPQTSKCSVLSGHGTNTAMTIWRPQESRRFSPGRANLLEGRLGVEPGTFCTHVGKRLQSVVVGWTGMHSPQGWLRAQQSRSSEYPQQPAYLQQRGAYGQISRHTS